MQHATAAWRPLLLCQNLGRHTPILPTHFCYPCLIYLCCHLECLLRLYGDALAIPVNQGQNLTLKHTKRSTVFYHQSPIDCKGLERIDSLNHLMTKSNEMSYVHTIAHFTGPSFMLQDINQLNEKFLGLLYTFENSVKKSSPFQKIKCFEN